MKILVIGGTRGIGLALAKQALAEGYEVTVLARHPEAAHLQHEKLQLIKGDVADKSAVASAVRGQDAVVSAVGIKPTRKPVTVFSVGTRNILDGMKKDGGKLLIAVTGVGAGDSAGHGGFLYDRIFLPLFMKNLYADKDRQEKMLKDSGAKWIIVRPGFLTNGPARHRFRAVTELGAPGTGVKAGRISRADVAGFILDQIRQPEYIGKTPLLTD